MMAAEAFRVEFHHYYFVVWYGFRPVQREGCLKFAEANILWGSRIPSQENSSITITTIASTILSTLCTDMILDY